MNHFNKRAITTIALACSTMLMSASTEAALITQDFSVTIDTTTSPLFNQVFSGSFSYDDADLPMTGFNGEDLFALHSFSFDFAGSVYGLADLFYGDAVVLGNQFLGLDLGALDFSFLPASDPFAASFAYDFGDGDAGNGSVLFSSVGEAPEPMTALLFGTALLALGIRTRTKA